MNGPRLGGTGRRPDGRHVTWALASGVRGRRWRSTTQGPDGRLEAVLLLEVDREGALTRLELATEAGLLTLHPEPDGASMHGNTVRPQGMEHHALPWSDRHVLLVPKSPVTGAVAAAMLARRVGVGEGASVPAIEVGAGLAVREATWRVARVGAQRWRMLAADGAGELGVDMDEDGVPRLFDAATWPLERAE